MNTPRGYNTLNTSQKEIIQQAIDRLYLDGHGAIVEAIGYAGFSTLIPKGTNIRSFDFQSVEEFEVFMHFVETCIQKKWISRENLLGNVVYSPHLSLHPEVSIEADLFITWVITEWHGWILYALAHSGIWEILNLDSKITNLSFGTKQEVDIFKNLVSSLISNWNEIQSHIYAGIPTLWDILNELRTAAQTVWDTAQSVSDIIQTDPSMLALKVNLIVRNFASFEDAWKNEQIENIATKILSGDTLTDVEKISYESEVKKVQALLDTQSIHFWNKFIIYDQERTQAKSKNNVQEMAKIDGLVNGIINECKAIIERVKEINNFSLEVFRFHPELLKKVSPIKIPELIIRVAKTK